MNSTFSSLRIATPESANLERMLTGLASKFAEIVQRFRKGTPTPEMALAFETELEACCREGCRTLVEAEYNDIEPTAIKDCPVRMRLAGEDSCPLIWKVRDAVSLA